MSCCCGEADASVSSTHFSTNAYGDVADEVVFPSHLLRACDIAMSLGLPPTGPHRRPQVHTEDQRRSQPPYQPSIPPPYSASRVIVRDVNFGWTEVQVKSVPPVDVSRIPAPAPSTEKPFSPSAGLNDPVIFPPHLLRACDIAVALGLPTDVSGPHRRPNFLSPPASQPSSNPVSRVVVSDVDVGWIEVEVPVFPSDTPASTSVATLGAAPVVVDPRGDFSPKDGLEDPVVFPPHLIRACDIALALGLPAAGPHRRPDAWM